MRIFDVVGRLKGCFAPRNNVDVMDIGWLDKGVYCVEVIDLSTGSKVMKKLIKE